MHEGEEGDCLKYLQKGWNREEGRGNKDFKKRGQAGSMGGCLKKGGGLEPSYKLWYGVSKIKPCLTHYENSLMFHTIDCMTVLEALSLSAIF